MKVELALAMVNERHFDARGFATRGFDCEEMFKGACEWRKRSENHAWSRTLPGEKSFLLENPCNLRETLCFLNSLSRTFSISLQGFVRIRDVDGDTNRWYFHSGKINYGEDAYDNLIYDLATGQDRDKFHDYNEHLAAQITREYNFYPDVISAKLLTVKVHVACSE